ncbi:MAG TPA: hypothetical protein PLQ76_03170 [bacterium]|nr:hypothetical protein [bacterium]
MRILGYVFLITGVALYFISTKFAAGYPDSAQILPQMKIEPAQTQATSAEFKASAEGVEYTVTPLYDYELYGMVVSFHHSKELSDMAHRLWKDYLNVADICVLWGTNLDANLYENFEFASGNFTCFFRTNLDAAFQKFDKYKISNNHLITVDPAIKKTILKARRGDQIYFKGFLANYSQNSGATRKSSTTRLDEGQGACEVVYVTDFRILKSTNMPWRAARAGSLLLTAVGLIVLIAGFFSSTPAPVRLE